MAATTESLTIRTADGACPAYVARPSTRGPRHSVLMLMDGFGIRPALHEMAMRLAGLGYFVLMPDLFYRAGPYGPVDAPALVKDPAKVKDWFARYFPTITPDGFARDLAAFVGWLDRQDDVVHGRIGVTGYCMGGALALRAAAALPGRVALAASFHGGRLATDQPDSPHLLVRNIRGFVYVAGAIEDGSFPDEMKERLADALGEAGVPHVVETYPAKHGWVMTDLPAYDRAAAERHWSTVASLLEEHVG